MTTNAVSTTNEYPIYNAKGEIAGYISGSTLIRIARSSDMHRIPVGWAWDTQILEEAKNVGVYNVIAVNQETNTHYEALLDWFWEAGQKINQGHAEEICLPLDYWMITDDWE